MNRHDLELLKRRYPIGPGVLALNDSPLRSGKPQPAQSPLGGSLQGVPPSPRSIEIRFDVFAVQPCDWDNYRTKELQDALVHAGILHGDDYLAIQAGKVVPHKVETPEEERTEVIITFL